jgi:excisionase family DNA binding protein
VTTINARAINYHDHEFTLITDDLLSIEEAGVRLGISGRLVNTMIKTHNLSTINFGGVVCIPAAEVARIKERPADSSIST